MPADVAPTPDAVEHVRAAYDPDGALDEVVIQRALSVVVERMDEGAWQIRVEFADGSAAYVELATKRPERTVVSGFVWREGSP